MRTLIAAVLTTIVASHAALAEPELIYRRFVLDLGPQALPFVVEYRSDGGEITELEHFEGVRPIREDELPAAIVNGSERIPFTVDCRAWGNGQQGTPYIEFGGFGSELAGSAVIGCPDAVTMLNRNMNSGAWRIRRSDGERRVRFVSTPIIGPDERFDVRSSSEPAAAFGGRWRVDFSQSDDDAVGVFKVDAETGLATGTFLTTTGDYRFLEGRVDGDLMRLSAFDGAHAFLFHARMLDDGTIKGDFWSGNWWHETWTAERDPDFELRDAYAETTQTAPIDTLSETIFPTLNAPGLQDGEHPFGSVWPEGSPTLLYVFGTWCPNCADAGAYLQTLHEKYSGDGLRVIGLAFERRTGAEAQARVRQYLDATGTPWPVLIAGLSDKTKASEALPIIDRVRSYPTIMFVNRDGSVRSIYTGFSGPATGEKYEKLKASFEANIAAMLAE